MRALALLALVCATAGCTAENPDFVGDAGTGIRPGADLAVAKPRVDMATPPIKCSGVERGCPSPGTAAGCTGGVLAVDRTCPAATSCMGGHCQVPATKPGDTVGTRCSSEADCAGTDANTCDPFVLDANGTVDWRCAHRIGTGISGTKCDVGDDCRTGFCIPATGTCFRLCNGTDRDCPVGDKGIPLRCRPQTIYVEGVAVTALGCVAP